MYPVERSARERPLTINVIVKKMIKKNPGYPSSAR
jgi:hypothetical protein